MVVIHKENGGVAMARNVALRKAKGDYFMFVDSDDWVEPDFCESALSQLLENNVSLASHEICIGWKHRLQLHVQQNI